MNREDAIRSLMVFEDFNPKDCVDLVCKYVSFIRDGEFPYPNETDITAAAITRTLGTKPKRKREYGDIVLYDETAHFGIGIFMGNARLATVSSEVEGMRGEPMALIRTMPQTKRMLFWRPEADDAA